ncbi:MAG: N-acyl-D-amino-acid deacylase family protein [Candidatus Hodarchaeales archaeon]
MEYDIILKKGTIIDGSGRSKYKADLAVLDGKIVRIEERIAGTAREKIDVKNFVISPGFIDMHSHSDISLAFDQHFSSVVRQGITTQVVGNCGWSLAPVDEENIGLLVKDFEIFIPPGKSLEITWKTFQEYLDTMQKRRIVVNIVPLVGFGAIRIAGDLGYEDREPTDTELNQMKKLVEEAVKAGAWGFSTGLVYTPQSYAKTGEIVELMKVVAKYNRLYFSHIRGEGSNLINAVKEFIEIVKKSGARGGQIAHHKVSGKQHWGLSKESLRLIDKANDQGLDISCDQYPFSRGMTSLISLLPDWVHEGGTNKLIERLRDPNNRERIKSESSKADGTEGIREVRWENIYIAAVKTQNWKDCEGLSIAEISRKKNINDCFTTLFEIIVDEAGEVVMHIETMCEEDIQNIMRHSKTMFGTDGWGLSPGGPMDHGIPHPRFYGTFPRILGHYVREKKIFSLEQAIHKMTGLPAEKLGLEKRGLLKKDYWADIVVFNPLTIKNRATYGKAEFPEGIKYVIVNGKLVVKDNSQLEEYSGLILRDHRK